MLNKYLYPFGSVAKGRSFSSQSYRYGFNGKEKDDEVSGSGNSYDFGSRMYDSRLGRWFSMDSHVSLYPGNSPYDFGLDNPMIVIDIAGNYIYIIGKVNDKNVKIKYEPGASPPKGADKFVQDAFKALNNKISKGEGDHIAAFAVSKDNHIKLKYGKQTFYRNGVVKWNNSEGFVAVQYSDPDNPKSKDTKMVVNLEDKRTIFSPEDALGHEFKHGEHDKVTKTLDNDVEKDPVKNKGYKNREEEKTIDEVDNGKDHYRKSHGGIPFKADNVSDKNGEIELDQTKDGKTFYKNKEVILEKGGAVEIKKK